MPIDIHVDVPAAWSGAVSAALDAQLAHTAPGPIRAAIEQWAVFYRAEMRDRFDAYSKGRGDWAPLSIATILRRRKGRKLKRAIKKWKRAVKSGIQADIDAAIASMRSLVSILRNTGVLFAALDPEMTNAPGAFQEHVPFGIRVGFGGPATYPGGATIADVAGYHQHGTTHVPARPILVAPSATTKTRMARALAKAITRIIR